MTEYPPVEPPRKSRWGWCCAGCVILPLLTSFCLVEIYYLVPIVSDDLNLFGPDAEKVYSRDQFFSQMEVDILTTIQYLELDHSRSLEGHTSETLTVV